jgi:hypothetical protein
MMKAVAPRDRLTIKATALRDHALREMVANRALAAAPLLMLLCRNSCLTKWHTSG